MNYENTSLWQKTLARQLEPDVNERKRELLRVEFEHFRERAKTLASEINRTLPEFTVHDISHIDALWDTAELVTKDCTNLNPAEAFVLGGAFLIHDLGMGLAAFPNGIAELKSSDIWKDIVASLLKKELGRSAKPDEINNLDSRIEKIATEQVLRQLHAQQAGKLALTSWRDENGTEIFLIDNLELRNSYGQIIGLIAYSHWWPVDELENRLGTILGAPGDFPIDWTIDVIKLACILRIADAIQIDDRRAPKFLRAIRKPKGYSDLHWNFQQKLYQPRLERSRLVYTSKSPFSINEVDSWWVCYDTLKMIDKELKEVDSLLADTNRPRLNPIGVTSIESPHRISKLIKVDGWSPVDTQIKVTNVAKLVNSLGGKYLYGDNIIVPLRELIQNSSDAIRARRLLENENESFGYIRVSTGKDENGFYIEVEDNGVGMSPKVLTEPFLDFGESFWGSSLMHEELPSLESKGFISTGKYGIGFYSVFMWGKKVSVYTKRYDKGREQTTVLEFNNGVYSRPILRNAVSAECIKDGGTKVRVWFSDGMNIHTLLLSHSSSNLKEAILSLCPSLDCNLFFENHKNKLIKANDWKTILPLKLMKRIIGESKFKSLDKDLQKSITTLSENMQLLKEEDGSIVGRLFLHPTTYDRFRCETIGGVITVGGVVTIGGLSSSGLSGLLGILVGKSDRASRLIGIPTVSDKTLKKWAENQAIILSNNNLSHDIEANCASLIRVMRGNPMKLKYAINKGGWINNEELRKMIYEGNFDEYIIVQDAAIYNYELENKCKIQLNENVIYTEMGVPGILQYYDFTNHIFWPDFNDFDSKCLKGLVIESIADVWNMSLKEIKKYSKLSTDKKSYSAEIGIANGNHVTMNDVDIIRRKQLE